jgi:hypothetical protein
MLVEDLLHDEGPGEEARDEGAEDGDDGDEGVAQRMAEDDVEAPESLGPRGDYVVGLHDLEHARSREPRREGDVEAREGEDGKEITAGIGDAVGREPSQLEREDVQEDGGDDEGGDGDAQGGEGHDEPVGPFVLPERGEDAEGHAQGEDEEKRHGAETGGDREALADELIDAHALVLDRGSQVQPGEALEVDDELPPQRLVEVVARAQRLLHLRRQHAVAREGPAGNGVHEEEGQGHDEEKGHDHGDKALGYVPSHDGHSSCMRKRSRRARTPETLPGARAARITHLSMNAFLKM